MLPYPNTASSGRGMSRKGMDANGEDKTVEQVVDSPVDDPLKSLPQRTSVEVNFAHVKYVDSMSPAAENVLIKGWTEFRSTGGSEVIDREYFFIPDFPNNPPDPYLAYGTK